MKKNKLVIIIGILFLLLGVIFGGMLYFLEWDKAMLWEHGKIEYVTQYAEQYNFIRDGEMLLMLGGIIVLSLLLVLAVIGLLLYKKSRTIFIITIIVALIAPVIFLGYSIFMWIIPIFIAGCLVFALFCFMAKEF